MMFSSIRFMGSVTFWGAAPVAKAKVNEQVESLETRVAFREALVSLRAAQRHLARREGSKGADTNAVLAGEIEAAIREIHTAGTWEFDSESEGLGEECGSGKYGAALFCLGKAEKALARVNGRGSDVQRTALLHVRTAKWWVEPKATPRYTQVLAVAR
jgi:hypothetical protein